LRKELLDLERKKHLMKLRTSNFKKELDRMKQMNVYLKNLLKNNYVENDVNSYNSSKKSYNNNNKNNNNNSNNNNGNRKIGLKESGDKRKDSLKKNLSFKENEEEGFDDNLDGKLLDLNIEEGGSESKRLKFESGCIDLERESLNKSREDIQSNEGYDTENYEEGYGDEEEIVDNY
jgi:hypothetical protein